MQSPGAVEAEESCVSNESSVAGSICLMFLQDGMYVRYVRPSEVNMEHGTWNVDSGSRQVRVRMRWGSNINLNHVGNHLNGSTIYRVRYGNNG